MLRKKEAKKKQKKKFEGKPNWIESAYSYTVTSAKILGLQNIVTEKSTLEKKSNE